MTRQNISNLNSSRLAIGLRPFVYGTGLVEWKISHCSQECGEASKLKIAKWDLGISSSYIAAVVIYIYMGMRPSG